MAQPKKVREFLTVAHFDEIYMLMSKGLYEQIAVERMIVRDKDGVLTARVLSTVMGQLKDLVVDYLTTIYGQLFTDDEIDQLIAFHSSPTMKKLREAMPEIQQAFVFFLSDQLPTIEKVIDQVLEKLERKT